MYKCNMCPNRCQANRSNGEYGRCRATNDMVINKISLHKFEEPCITGTNGSGTIFFSGCNLSCVYCQNYEISQTISGKIYTPKMLAREMIKLQELKATNINLVSPTIYIEKIIESIKLAKDMGLSIPIIYNTNGYENVENIKKLKDVVDVYLPDYKYATDELGKTLSGVDCYATNIIVIIGEMLKQKQENIYDKCGNILSGVIIRHLILPNHVQNSKQVLESINSNYGNTVCVSIMSQYFPTYKANEKKYKIDRKINKIELNSVETFLFNLNIENGYIQKLGRGEEQFVPTFDIDQNSKIH